eukprot:15447559-Alexandrium_andersonii.AAC.1
MKSWPLASRSSAQQRFVIKRQGHVHSPSIGRGCIGNGEWGTALPLVSSSCQQRPTVLVGVLPLPDPPPLWGAVAGT